MSEYIEITTQNLDADRNTIQEEVKALQNDVKEFAEEISQLNSLWEGPASAAFARQAAEDVEKIKEICSTLAEYIESMEYAAKSYVKCEKTVTDIIDKIRV